MSERLDTWKALVERDIRRAPGGRPVVPAARRRATNVREVPVSKVLRHMRDYDRDY
jgi:hypothetical protein